ncbi:XdhC family protein [Xanthobacter sp. DSM 24535]|uniref:XdhC family protein n=1 Tax=Roseixanthobacter psychrophilus TaxID=3119917 RepID=UPI00372B39E6
MTSPIDMFALMDGMKQKEQPFALATVVRTVSVTAAKAGAKALILPDGTVLAGWIGGGCARGATLKAAREALADGQPRLVSIQPEDLLSDLGVHAGETREGVRYVSNMCPSKGTMDIFVEPVLPRPELVVMGASPVAVALVALAPQFGFSVTAAAPAADHAKFAGADHMTDGFAPPPASGPRFVVVSTQGAGDLAALTAALGLEARHVAFVGSRRKAQTLSEKLRDAGVPQARLDVLKAPAGLDLGAITPEEIALSILAELVLVRRRDQRGAAA